MLKDLQPAINALIIIFTFFVLLLVYTKIFGPIPFSVNSVQTTKQDTFSVNGEGKVSAVPDMAVVTVGVQASGSNVSEAQNKLNTNINKVSAAIKQLGVDAKDIQTTNYNLTPNYDNNPKPAAGNIRTQVMPGPGSQESLDTRISGYSANSNLVIKVRDIAKANSVIDTATAQGVNQVGGISFDFADKTKLEDQARELAVAEAKKKAQQAAKIAGFTLGKIINYQENFGGVTPMAYTAKSEVADGRGTIPTQVEPGSSEVRVYVTLSYEVR
jgi:hypothetical protein